jgi:hypothetical protein
MHERQTHAKLHSTAYNLQNLIKHAVGFRVNSCRVHLAQNVTRHIKQTL